MFAPTKARQKTSLRRLLRLMRHSAIQANAQPTTGLATPVSSKLHLAQDSVITADLATFQIFLRHSSEGALVPVHLEPKQGRVRQVREGVLIYKPTSKCHLKSLFLGLKSNYKYLDGSVGRENRSTVCIWRFKGRSSRRNAKRHNDTFER